MVATTTIMSCSYSTNLFFRDALRLKPAFVNLNRNLSSSNQQGFASNYPLLSLRIHTMAHSKHDTKMNFIVHNSVRPGNPIPSGNASHSWKGWVLGMLLSIILPFCKPKLNPFIALKHEVETVVETVEFVVEMVEKVAEEVVEIADDFGDKLPEGKLKYAVDMVENIAREIAKDAHLADNLIDKVEDMEKEVESFIEPVFNQVEALTKEGNGKF